MAGGEERELASQKQSPETCHPVLIMEISSGYGGAVAQQPSSMVRLEQGSSLYQLTNYDSGPLFLELLAPPIITGLAGGAHNWLIFLLQWFYLCIECLGKAGSLRNSIT